ncbi:MAG TPA: thiol reductant ABC exporter subunit CydC [Lacisediminihabitans sp.]|uniref:thiol reductant ABC exporter subunit CydC n=1 Tax=Lacisediminihabitans sp. TaxID=2787631 RepID=UPI002EDB4F00
MRFLLTASERRSLRRVLGLLDIDARGVVLSVVLGSLGLGSAVALSATSAWLIARASQQPPVLYLTVAAVAVRMFGILRALMRYLQRLASHKVALTGMDALRQNLYGILSTSRVDRVVALRRGDLLARTGADVDEVGNLVVKSLLPAAVTLLVGVATVGGIAMLSPAAALILAICLLVSGVVTPLLTGKATRTVEADSRSARTGLSETTVSLMDGAAELQTSGRIDGIHTHLGRIEDSLTDATARAARISGLAAGVDRAAMGLAVVGALLVGIPETTAGLVAAVALAVLVLTPLASFEGTSELSAAASQLVRSAAAAERIDHLLGTDRLPEEHHLPTVPPTGPRLVVRNLAIGWPGGPIIARGIDLDLEVGSHLAVVGPSGIGKSTLLYTLAGMLPPVEGTVTLDGADVWAADRGDVASRVTVTAEDAHIFATTVYENIRVADADLTRPAAADLLDRAGLSEWLGELPAGLDTMIGSGGTTVSGGERRRLLLARALASPAPLLLLDEPAEHLDPDTADALMATLLGPEDSARGVLVVTHRLSGLAGADAVLVLDHADSAADLFPATIVERGTHSDLSSHRTSYRWALEQEAR